MLKDVASAAWDSLPGAETPSQQGLPRVGRLFLEAKERESSSTVADGLRYAERSFLSSCDHIQAFAALIEQPSRPSTSLVTLTRGALEAASRCWWITEDVPLGTHLHRVISMQYKDLQFAKNFPNALESSSDRSCVDAGEIRAGYAAELARLDLPPVKAENLSDLVEKLLSETTNLDSSQISYSAYSSIAHSQLSGLDAFAAPDRFGPETLFEAPLPILTSLSSQMTLSILAVAKRLTVWVGGPNAPIDGLDEASVRAGYILSELPSAAYSPDSPDLPNAPKVA